MTDTTSMTLSNVTAEEFLDIAIKEELIKHFEYPKFKNFKRLGSGAFGEVNRADIRLGGVVMTFALKDLSALKYKKIDHKVSEDFLKELKFLKKADYHPNILNFYGVTRIDDRYLLVLEYADGGSLREFLRRNFNTLDGKHKVRFAKEIASGLSCLHEEQILHRDMNSTNILVSKDTIKIADLGISKRQEDINVAVSEIRGHLPYMEPQCLIDHLYKRDQASDIYALGVVFWELTSGIPPFENIPKVTAAIMISQGSRERRIVGTPQTFVDLYEKCWDQKPKNRPNINNVIETLEKIIWDAPSPQYETEVSDLNNIYRSTVSPSEESGSGSVADLSLTTSDETFSREFLETTTTSPTSTGPMLDIFIPKPNIIATFNEEVDALPKLLPNGELSEADIQYLEELFDKIKGVYDAGMGPKRREEVLRKFLMENFGEKSVYDLVRQQESTKCLHILALCYELGVGTENDPTKAFKCYEELASQGDSYGQWKLGTCYRFASGTDNDLAKAVRYYELSAKQGNSSGEFNLGVCYEQGIGVPRDYQKAVHYYQRSAAKENLVSINTLGYCYQKQIGVPQNLELAFRCYKRAAERDYASAMYNLALCYKNGDGTPEDKDRALHWFQKAFLAGIEEAARSIKVLEEESLIHNTVHEPSSPTWVGTFRNFRKMLKRYSQ